MDTQETPRILLGLFALWSAVLLLAAWCDTSAMDHNNETT